MNFKNEPNQSPQNENTVEPGSIVIYTTAWCSACWRAKQVMDARRIDYTEIDITFDEDAAEFVMAMNRGYRSVPTIIFPDGSHLTEPLTIELVQKLDQLAVL